MTMKTTEISKEIKTQAEIEGQRIFDNNQKRNRPTRDPTGFASRKTIGRFPDHERWLTGSEMRLLTSNRVCEPLRQIVLPVPEERRLFGSA